MNAAIATPSTTAGRPGTGPRAADPPTPGPRAGRLIGVMFLAGFVTYGTGSILTTSVLDSTDVLGSVSHHQTAFAIGAVLMLSVVAIDITKAVLFLPILGRPGERTALAYLSGMIVEVVLMAAGVVALLTLIPLHEDVQSGATSAATGQSLGSLAVDANAVAYQASQACLAVGAFFLCVFLYRAHLIPTKLAAWGAIGYVLHFTGAVGELLGAHISLFLLLPGGLFELVLAAWLLLRGIEGTPAHPRSPHQP